MSFQKFNSYSALQNPAKIDGSHAQLLGGLYVDVGQMRFFRDSKGLSSTIEVLCSGVYGH